MEGLTLFLLELCKSQSNNKKMIFALLSTYSRLTHEFLQQRMKGSVAITTITKKETTKTAHVMMMMNLISICLVSDRLGVDVASGFASG